MYKAYQSAIVKSEALRCELLKGVRAGEDTKELLVKAAKIIALITGDTLFENLIS